MNNDRTKKILVFSTDNFFCIHAIALVKSIEKNSSIDGLEIHVLSDKISKENRKELESRTSLPVYFHDINKSFLKQHPLPHKTTFLPRSAYFRLFIPELFKNYSKVLYLDVDILVLRSLEPLFNLKFNGSLLLACPDLSDLNEKKKKIYDNFMKEKSSEYFNSGVMLINIKEWINFGVKKKSFDLLENEMIDPIFADQEVLNVVLENKWSHLDVKWNYPPHISDYNDLPNIIHFMGYKPIYKDYNDKHKDTFQQYLEGTKWENRDYSLFRKALIKGPYFIKTKFTQAYLFLKENKLFYKFN